VQILATHRLAGVPASRLRGVEAVFVFGPLLPSTTYDVHRYLRDFWTPFTWRTAERCLRICGRWDCAAFVGAVTHPASAQLGRIKFLYLPRHKARARARHVTWVAS
jgi:hypothetical protein